MLHLFVTNTSTRTQQSHACYMIYISQITEQTQKSACNPSSNIQHEGKRSETEECIRTQDQDGRPKRRDRGVHINHGQRRQTEEEVQEGACQPSSNMADTTTGTERVHVIKAQTRQTKSEDTVVTSSDRHMSAFQPKSTGNKVTRVHIVSDTVEKSAYDKHERMRKLQLAAWWQEQHKMHAPNDDVVVLANMCTKHKDQDTITDWLAQIPCTKLEHGSSNCCFKTIYAVNIVNTVAEALSGDTKRHAKLANNRFNFCILPSSKQHHSSIVIQVSNARYD